MSSKKIVKGDAREGAGPGAIAVQGPPYERVAAKAYELYLRRGQADGHDLEDWLEAESLVRSEMKAGHRFEAMTGPVSPAPRPLKAVGGGNPARIR